MAKVKINSDACISCGVCASMCSDVFVMDPESGKSSIVEQFRVGGNKFEGEIPADLVDCAKTAAENCPVSAITVEE